LHVEQQKFHAEKRQDKPFHSLFPLFQFFKISKDLQLISLLKQSSIPIKEKKGELREIMETSPPDWEFNQTRDA